MLYFENQFIPSLVTYTQHPGIAAIIYKICKTSDPLYISNFTGPVKVSTKCTMLLKGSYLRTDIYSIHNHATCFLGS